VAATGGPVRTNLIVAAVVLGASSVALAGKPPAASAAGDLPPSAQENAQVPDHATANAEASARPTEAVVGPGEAFETIQAAIDSARTGDTIRVRAGTYAESLVIAGGGSFKLDIRGYGDGDVVLQPAADQTVSMTVDSADLTLSDLTVVAPDRTDTGPTGIEVTDTAGVKATGFTLALCGVSLKGNGVAGSVGVACVIDGTTAPSIHGADVTISGFVTEVQTTCGFQPTWTEDEICPVR
jgi:hypothetical protein